MNPHTIKLHNLSNGSLAAGDKLASQICLNAITLIESLENDTHWPRCRVCDREDCGTMYCYACFQRASGMTAEDKQP